MVPKDELVKRYSTTILSFRIFTAQIQESIPHDHIPPVVCTVCVVDDVYVMPFCIAGSAPTGNLANQWVSDFVSRHWHICHQNTLYSSEYRAKKHNKLWLEGMQRDPNPSRRQYMASGVANEV